MTCKWCAACGARGIRVGMTPAALQNGAMIAPIWPNRLVLVVGAERAGRDALIELVREAYRDNERVLFRADRRPGRHRRRRTTRP
ncbi:MAG: hypothetical protein MZV49_22350 [Rhodopseudomonas palustris]|nr:hypothetical protein [Rhodopseudomonas palustris]